MISKYPDYDLFPRNTFRMRVKCALFVEISQESDLLSLDFDSLPQPVMVMGGGSNLLFTKDFPGTVLHVGEITALDQVQGIFGRGAISGGGPGPGGVVFLTISAGTVFDDFCAWAAEEGLWGPENLSLIPGEVGASAVQNIGAYGVEAKDIIAGIRAYDRTTGQFVDIDPADCEYGYRTSRFKTEWKGRFIITSVTYRLSREPQPKLDYGGLRKALEVRGWPEVVDSVSTPLTPLLVRQTIIDIRNSKLPDPAVTGSAGSFFCNPVISKEHFARLVKTAKADNGPDYEVPHYVVGDRIKVPAAWMIEQCGFKGKRLGGAQVYQKQPLVIINASGESSPEDIIALETEVIRTIEQKYGITLHPEVEHI